MAEREGERAFICISSSSGEEEEDENDDDQVEDIDNEEEEEDDDDDDYDDSDDSDDSHNDYDDDQENDVDEQDEDEDGEQNEGDDDESLCNKVMIRFLQEGSDLDSLNLKDCKAYLRMHGLRISGTKAVCIQRIEEHRTLEDGNGEALYPRSSFAINCTGDVCKGDVVLFTQKVYKKSDKVTRHGRIVGNRTVAGRVVNESYGAAKQQHTFTVEVLWSRGLKKLCPLFPLLVKGRNLYKLRTFRQRWSNEAERSEVLDEKHKRGQAARAMKRSKKWTADGGTMPPRCGRPRRDHHRVNEGADEPAQGFEQSIDRLAEAMTTAVRTLGFSEGNYSIESGCRLGASTFSGTTDPSEANEWMTKIERIFEVMSCSDDRKIVLATFFLEGDAYHWWNLERMRLTAAEITWDRFRRAFYEQYCPRVYCDDKKAEFQTLRQGLMALAESERKFTELSRFCPAQVADESEKCSRFKDGLREEIRTVVTATIHPTFITLREAARVERSLAERHIGGVRRHHHQSSIVGGPSQGPSKRGNFSSGSSRSGGFRGDINSIGGSQGSGRSHNSSHQSVAGSVRTFGFSEGQRSTRAHRRHPVCQTCGRHHEGPCQRGTRGCFHCGKMGHFRKDCPLLYHGNCGASRSAFHQGQTSGGQSWNQGAVQTWGGASSKGAQSNQSSRGGGQQRGQRGHPIAQGRVFSMTQQQAQASPDVIIGWKRRKLSERNQIASGPGRIPELGDTLKTRDNPAKDRS